MSVPEATMDNDQSPVFRENDIRFSRNVLDMNTVTEAQGMKPQADEHFGTRIFRPNA